MLQEGMLLSAVRTVIVLVLTALLTASNFTEGRADDRPLHSCARLFECHRDGHICPNNARDLTVLAPPLARSPHDSAVARDCVFRAPVDLTRPRSSSSRKVARVEDGVYVMLGHAEASLIAPLHSPRTLFFQNMSETYLQWHPEARVATSVQGINDDDDETGAVHESDREEADDVFEGTTVRAQHHSEELRRTLWYRHVAHCVVRRLVQWREQVRHYPWRTPAAFARLFCRRVTRLEYRVASWTAAPTESVNAFVAADDDSRASEAVDDEGETNAYGADVSTASLFSLGSVRGLRVVSFPPTPQLVSPQSSISPSSSSSSSSAASVSVASEAVRYTCDFRVVRAAKQHLDEGENYLGQIDSLGRGSVGAAEPTDVLFDLSEVDYDAADVFNSATDRRGRRPESKRFSIIAFIVARWLPDGLLGGARSSSSSSSSARPVHSASQKAAAAYLAMVHEELGPFQPSRTLLPATLRQLLGTRRIGTRQHLRLTSTVSDSNSSSRRSGRASNAGARRVRQLHYDFVFEAELPATQPMCLGISLSPIADVTRLSAASSSVGREEADTSSAVVAVRVSEQLVFDWLWLKLLLAYGLLSWMRPRVQDSWFLRVVTAGLCGAFILLVLLVFYVARHVQRMSVGKVGLAVVIAMGGMTAIAEGVVSVLQYALFAMQDQLTPEVWLYVGLAMAAVSVLSSLLVQWVFSEAVLQRSTRFGLQAVSGVVLALTYRRSAEATVLALVLSLVARPHRVMRVGRWCGGLVCWRSADSEPTDVLPDEARREVRYAVPLTSEGQRYRAPNPTRHRNKLQGQTRAQEKDGEEGERVGEVDERVSADYARKMRQYDDEGARHTRLALEQLAAHVRANPDRYVDRVADPNRLYRWAGCVQTEQADEDIDADLEADSEDDEVVSSDDQQPRGAGT